MTDRARIHLPRISARRCLQSPETHEGDVRHYCTRALGHTLRHAAAYGTRRDLVAVWSS